MYYLLVISWHKTLSFPFIYSYFWLFAWILQDSIKKDRDKKDIKDRDPVSSWAWLLTRVVRTWTSWFINFIDYSCLLSSLYYALCVCTHISHVYPSSYHHIHKFSHPSCMSDWWPCHHSAEPRAVALIDMRFARHLNLRRWVPLMCYSGWGISFNRSKPESERNLRGSTFKAKFSLGVTQCQTLSCCGWVNKPEWNDERDIRATVIACLSKTQRKTRTTPPQIQPITHIYICW